MVGSRRMMMMAGARTALLSSSCRTRTVTSSCTIRTRAAATATAGRWNSSFGANKKDNDSDDSSSASSSIKSSSMDQHRMFLEQMNELQSEQRQLFGTLTDPVEFDLGSMIQRQSQVQPQHHQNDDDEEEEEECTITPADHEPADDNDDDLSWERKKQDRELLYGFTEQDHVAWANHGRSNQHDDHGASGLTMAEIIRHRAAHFARLDRQAEESPPPAAEGEVISTTPLSQQQQEGSTSSRTSAPSLALSHVSADGSTLHMVDVGEKPLTTRIATAETIVQFPPAVVTALRKSSSNINNNGELLTKKGPVFATAITAGIMAAKQTSNLIPLCHPLFLSKVDVTIDWVENEAAAAASRDDDDENNGAAVRVTCTCKVANGPTGVEMEALVGCSVAALTIYDMVKAVSHDVVIAQTRLLHKEGGKRHLDIRHRPKTTTK